jgi:hypothetical protein
MCANFADDPDAGGGQAASAAGAFASLSAGNMAVLIGEGSLAQDLGFSYGRPLSRG